MNGDKQTQDSPYSSDSDSFFSQCVFKAPGGKDSSGSKSNRLKQQTSDQREVFSWAARLELESITLKDTIRNDLMGSMNSVVDAITTLTDKFSGKLDSIETSLQSLTSSSSLRNQLQLEKIQQAVDTKLNSNNESIVNEIKLLLQSERSLGQDSKLKSLTEEVQSLSKLVKTCSTKITNTTKINKSQQQQKQPQVVHPTTDEINEIKQYLKLLLPRIIGIENYYKDLALTYAQLSLQTKSLCTTKPGLPLIEIESELYTDIDTEPEPEPEPKNVSKTGSTSITTVDVPKRKVNSRKRRKIL